MHLFYLILSISSRIHAARQKMGTPANSVDPDEMLHIAASHQGHHCLQS